MYMFFTRVQLVIASILSFCTTHTSSYVDSTKIEAVLELITHTGGQQRADCTVDDLLIRDGLVMTFIA